MAHNVAAVNGLLTEAKVRALLDIEAPSRIRDIIAKILRQCTKDEALASRIGAKVLTVYLDPAYSSLESKTRLILGLYRAIIDLYRQIDDYKAVIRNRKSEDEECAALKHLTQKSYPELDDEGLNIVTRYVLRSSKTRLRGIREFGELEAFHQELLRIRKYVDLNSYFVSWINPMFHRDNSFLSLSAKLKNFEVAAQTLNQIRDRLQRSIELCEPSAA